MEAGTIAVYANQILRKAQNVLSIPLNEEEIRMIRPKQYGPTSTTRTRLFKFLAEPDTVKFVTATTAELTHLQTIPFSRTVDDAKRTASKMVHQNSFQSQQFPFQSQCIKNFACLQIFPILD
ncbi:Uncharacterized protein Fot_02322 [Forsythia ovata]|uniref:Uncharacterized protein n=1 Tax=Forsythia ovata TaxID=205694 RepID=A0ABD1X9K9_9LAMI